MFKRLIKQSKDKWYRIINPLFSVHQTPVIILGNQKSGTSAIAQLLADIGGIPKTIDIPPLWLPMSADIIRKKLPFEKIVNQNRRYFSTEMIKEPNMIFFLDQVISTFPNARYVFVIRDPRDNIRSILDRRSIPGNLDSVTDNILPNHWRGVIFDPDIWGGQGENYIGVLAHRWNLAVENYLFFQDRIILIRYEDFLTDKVGTISSLAKQLQIPIVMDISQKVDIQYQPRGAHRSVRWSEFFGRANLARIEAICAHHMSQFRYALTDRNYADD